MLGFLLKYCTSAHMQIHTKWGGDIRNKIGLEMLTVETGRWDPSVTPFYFYVCWKFSIINSKRNKQKYYLIRTDIIVF